MTGKSVLVKMKMTGGFNNDRSLSIKMQMGVPLDQKLKHKWPSRRQAVECALPEYTLEFKISKDGSTKGAGGRPIVHFILGGPGSGKSTNCKRIAEAQGFVHISVGQLRRQEAAKPTSKYGEAINKCLDYGDIIDADVAIQMLQEEMTRQMERPDWANKTFLIDGFPRNAD